MPTPTLSFANNLQDLERLDLGLAFGNSADLIEELVRSIPVLLRTGSGESYTVANTTDVSSLAAFRAVGTSPSGGTPGNSGIAYTYQRVTALSEPDLTLSHANRQPNDILEADRAARETSILRLLGSTLLLGDNTATGGFLGWEMMTPGIHRTDLAFIGPGAGQVLETLYRIDDSAASGPLGDRVTAFVTTPRGRRNIVRAAQLNGFDLEYKLTLGVPNEVPHFAGRPILTTSADLEDEENPNQIPIYGVDFTQVFLVTTTGARGSRGIELRPMPLQVAGTTGYLQWMHGACVVRHPSALIRAMMTMVLSS